jgi:Uma2 family endonuclease
VFVPDLVVGRPTDTAGQDLRQPPVLAVEVLSPTTRRFDVGRKYTAYERAGLAHYWIVDPLAPEVRVVEHRHGRFCTTATATGPEGLVLTRPFPVNLVPDVLVRS